MPKNLEKYLLNFVMFYEVNGIQLCGFGNQTNFFDLSTHSNISNQT